MKKITFVLLLISAISGTTFGAIVYSGSTNVTIDLGGSSDVNETISIAGTGDSWDDFTVELLLTMGTGLYVYPGSPGGMGTGTAGIVITTSGIATNLVYGDLIGLSSSFGFYVTLSQGSSGGEFGPSGGYIGLRTENNHYAWLHMLSQSDIGLSTHSVTFDGWAYEDVENVAIKAGAVPVPVPGALALGGLGAGLVACLRRRKAA